MADYSAYIEEAVTTADAPRLWLWRLDPINAIRNTVQRAFEDRSGSGDWFDGFSVYRFQSQHTALTPPCIVLRLESSPATVYGMGEHREDGLTLHIDLVFKETLRKEIGPGETYEGDELAQWFLIRVMHVLNTLSLDGIVNETGRTVTGQIHAEPMEGSNFFLHGCIVTMDFLYEGDID